MKRCAVVTNGSGNADGTIANVIANTVIMKESIITTTIIAIKRSKKPTC
jgi:hypothetical protein